MIRRLSDRFSPPVAKRTCQWGIAILLLAAAGGSFWLHAEHAELTESRHVIANIINETIPNYATVIGSADDCIYFLPHTEKKIYYMNVASLPVEFELYQSTYLIDISYTSQQDTGGTRYKIVDMDRQKIKDYIQMSRDKIEMIFERRAGNNITIWRVK